jgi:hypothetical protein
MALTQLENTLLATNPAVLYGPEAWYVALREDHKLRAFEKKMLGILCRPKRKEVT